MTTLITQADVARLDAAAEAAQVEGNWELGITCFRSVGCCAEERIYGALLTFPWGVQEFCMDMADVVRVIRAQIRADITSPTDRQEVWDLIYPELAGTSVYLEAGIAEPLLEAAVV